jgi:amino acid adenylation domain-containing protein
MADQFWLHQYIEQRAVDEPQAIAVELEGSVMRYGELNALAGALAKQLVGAGVGPNVIVALAMERSFELVVAILAILKAGGAYLPLDPGYPKARLSFMLQDAAPVALLVNNQYAGGIHQSDLEPWYIDLESLRLAAADDPIEDVAFGPNGDDDLVYVIYTSGSTGKPKGCMIEHRALANRIDWMQKTYPIGPNDAVLQKTPYTFDVSVWEFLWPLMTGARLVLARPDAHRDNRYLMRCIDEHGVTACHFVPSMLQHFLADLEPGQALGLRHLFLSGEVLHYDLMQEALEKLPATALHNLYGPTEAAIDVTYWDCERRDDRIVPIGRAISNIDLFILGDDGKPVTSGETGELHIAGVGLARGYLNRPELTAEKFFDYPDPSGLRRRLYKAGDRVRLLEDGNLAYNGRVDLQVKLRGFRIELGEIEETLLEDQAVRQAVVMVDASDGADPRLVAHIAGDVVSTSELRQTLKDKLPAHMVPNRFIVHDQLPLTTHGKVDRKGLLPGRSATSQPPTDTIEDITTRVTEVVGQYLDGVRLGLDDDLFDHGATSFTLMRLSRGLQDTLGITMTLETFLLTPTIRGIVEQCSSIDGRAEDTMEQPPVGSIKITGGGPDYTAVTIDEGSVSESESQPQAYPIGVCITQSNTASEDKVTDPAKRCTSNCQPVEEAVCENLPGQALPSDLEETVARQCRQLLDLETLDGETDLFDLGATSFTLMRLARVIDTEFNIAISIETFLENPTLSGIVRAVRALLPDETAASSERRAAQSVSSRNSQTQQQGESQRVITIPREYACPIQVLGTNLGAKTESQPLSTERLGRFLSRMRAVRVAERTCYLVPSGGGKYAVQLYVIAGNGSVDSLAAGAYYYQPEEHRLYRLSTAEALAASKLQVAGVRIVLVAQLKALEKTYERLSPLLATLDTGYIIQLLSDGQQQEGLRLSPTDMSDGTALYDILKLDEAQHVLACLSVLCPAFKEDGIGTKNPIQPVGRRAGHKPIVALSYAETDYLTTPLTGDEQTRYESGVLHLRSDFRQAESIDLPTRAYPLHNYIRRGSRRDYARRPVSQSDFYEFMNLFGAEVVRLGRQDEADVPFHALVRFYLLVQADTISGIDGGLWLFDPLRHALEFVNADVSAAIRKGFYPFNRGHFDQAAFTLLLIAPSATVANDQRLHEAVIASGMLGQRLMWRQADFNLGLCPIGWMHLDPARQACGFAQDDQYIHGFTGGYYDHNQPLPLNALDWPASPLDRKPPQLPVPVDEIAVIGISGRYPGARDIWQLWQCLRDRRCSITALPEQRWHEAQLRGGFLDDIDRFDSLLFNIAPPEARTMDPQERLFLEVVWECLESAGYTPQRLRESASRVGVFLGVMWGDYQKIGAIQGEPGPTSTYSSIPNRVSHFFNFQGPSLAVDTGCSSALTALHLASESLRKGECDAALVGGVNLISHPDHLRVLSDLDLLASDQTSHVFGAEGDGWVVGEGVGALLLRPRHIAQRQADPLYALICGSATTHRGRSRARNMPNPDGQVASLKTLFKRSGVDPASIDYVEASAAGSGIADAAEVAALERVLGPRRDGRNVYRMGSIKGNLGHLESASGMAQLTKVVLQMQYGRLVSTLVPRHLNPFIDWDNAAGALVVENQAWESSRSRRSLVSGYSAEGVCSHVLVDEAPVINRYEGPARQELIVLSAATHEQLQEYAGRLSAHLSHCCNARSEELPAILRNLRLCDLAYTLQVGRVAMRHRLATVADTLYEVIDRLARFAHGEEYGPELLTAIHVEETPQEASIERPPTSLFEARDAWLQGAVIDWSGLPGRKADAGVIPLPCYPFARERHWIDKAPTAGVALESQSPDDSSDSERRYGLSEMLCRIYAEEAEITLQRVKPNTPLEALGLNSLLVVRVNSRLDALGLGLQRRTLLFEFRCLSEVTDYLLTHHGEAVAKLLGDSGKKDEEMPSHGHRVMSQSAATEAVDNPGACVGEQEPIAVIGMAAQYPDADTLEAFWQNLLAGRNSVREVPPERWDWRVHYADQRGSIGHNYCRYGAFIDGAAHFDPLFFNISPTEAETMDPQERLFLQTAWAAVEDAGWRSSALGECGQVGVFVGVMNDSYERVAADAVSTETPARAQMTRYWSIANRVSYQLDVQGPSMAVDTACSSSLTAVHLACESLRHGECDIALAGGVNLLLHPSHYISLSSATMLSNGDRCRPFGADADGTVIGEGAGCILLKPLQQAVADGDHIYGVIRGSAINSDGRTNGYTVANPRAQGEVVSLALRRAGVHPRSLSYLEAHGTGTALGDPIEIEGLCQAFASATNDNQFCALGSVKSNIGHLESAAGIAGLTKVLLQLKHRRYVPSLHAEPANPDIDFSRTPFRLQTFNGEWRRPCFALDGGEVVEYPRRAGVSSFGAGGVNVHVVVEEYLPEDDRQSDRIEDGANVIVLSAKRDERLREASARLHARLHGDTRTPLRDIAFTLQTGREAMRFRLAIVAAERNQLLESLRRAAAGDYSDTHVYSGEVDSATEAVSVDTDIVRRGELHTIARSWVKGASIDWFSLASNRASSRVPLPTYPFEKQAYWIGGAVAKGGTRSGPRKGQKSPRLQVVETEGNEKSLGRERHRNTDDCPHQPRSSAGEATQSTAIEFNGFNGLAIPVLVRDEIPRRSGLPGTLWVFDTRGEATAAINSVTGNSDSVVRILPGERFQREGRTAFKLDPGDAGQYQTLVETLLADDLAPAAIINQWLEGEFDGSPSSMERQLRRGFYAWGHLARALVKAGHRLPTRFMTWLPETTPGDHPIVGAQESLLRGMAAEFSWLSYTLVESSLPASESAAVVIDELWSQSSEVVHYRGSERWRKSFRPLDIGSPDGIPMGRGIYIIAGGGGGIGRHLSRHLIRDEANSVVLLGRSRLSDAQHEQLERQGQGRLSYRAVDIADAEALSGALHDIRQRVGPITGVIHCAGVMHNARVVDQQSLTMSAVLAAKLFGTANLDRLTREDPLESFILFSSLTAEIAPPGQSDYAFANGFIDHYARWRERQRMAGHCRGRSLAIDWPYWRDGGLRMDEDLLELLQRRWGVEAIDSGQAMVLLEKLRHCEQPQVLVVPGDAEKVDRMLRAASAPAGGTRHAPRSLTADALGETLAQEVSSISKVDPELIDGQTPLAEYGFDSIMLTRLAHALSERLELDLTPSDLLEYPTIDHLQAFIESAGKTEPKAVSGPNGGDADPVSTLPSDALAEIPNRAASASLAAPAPLRPHPWIGDPANLKETARAMIKLDASDPVLGDHCINGSVLLPGSGYVEVVRAAAIHVLACDAIELRQVSWQQPLHIDPRRTSVVELSFDAHTEGRGFRISEVGGGSTYAQGVVTRLDAVSSPTELDLQALRLACPQVRQKDEIYPGLRAAGFEYGPLYQSIDTLYIGQGQALARVSLHEGEGVDAFQLHPALLDGALQTALGATSNDDPLERLQVPFFLKRLRQWRALPAVCWVHARRCAGSSSRVERFDIVICDEQGQVLLAVDQFSVRPLMHRSLPDIGIRRHAESGDGQTGAVTSERGSEPKRRSAPRVSEPIAVIGVAGRFPQSADVETFWRHLRESDDLISEVSAARWDWRRFFSSRKGVVGKTYSRWAGYLPDVGYYDPAYFRIRPDDARAMDIQHLLMLELTQQLLDAAGYRASEVAGRNVAVILGAAADDCPATTDPTISQEVAKAAVVLSIQNMIAARISDFYDLHGESLTIDTACSSSLVAIHNACRALRAGECEMAIAGGVTLLLDEAAHVHFSQAAVLSDDPHSYVFDKRAKGFVLGEGAGLVLLKRYDEALADGDRILGVVRGSAINNDGRTMGITTPNVKMQQAAIRQAIDNADVDPRTIGYLEAHGTGTLLGDPIEIKAASQAYGEFTRDLQYCTVGSVKSNMGHLLLAAGVASFIKVIMMLQHHYIPQTLHCETPHPRFEFEGSPFRPALRGESWHAIAERRRAAISGFGFGGTNCHMILEQFVPERQAYQQRRTSLPPTQFNRICCWRPQQTDAAVLHTGTRGEGVPERLPRNYTELIKALEQGHISVEEAVALESTLDA